MRFRPLFQCTLFVALITVVWSGSDAISARNIANDEPPVKGWSRSSKLRFKTAWVMQNDRPNRHQRFLFKPITDVIIAGFAANNLSSHYYVTESYHCSDACLRKEWLKPQKGDVFVWVGQLGQIEIPWKQLQARGVFTIYYQTEPREACDLHRSDGIDEVWDYSWHNIEVCQAQEARENTHPRTRLRYIPPGFNVAAHDPYYAQAAASAGASVTPMGDVMKVEQPPSDQATLIFFGSLDRWSHRSNCWKFLQNSPLMAWPEGKGAPAWAVSDHGGRGDNVMTATSPTAAANAAAGKRRKLLTGNDNSNNRKKPGAAEADAAAAAVGAQQELAANVPSSKEGGGRGGESSKDAGKGDGGGGGIEEAPEKERAPLVGGGETSRLVSLYDVWTDAAFANFSKLPGVGLFLIIKKGCNPKGADNPHGAMTTLRNSQLLNAHALIIAEKVNVKDMSEYYGLISFVNIGQVPNEWNRLMRMPIKKRQSLADFRAATFAERFHPKAIFERAGVPEMLFL